MANEITFEVLGIAEVLKRNRLIVPPNQREYSWYRESQVRDLLHDISVAITADSETLVRIQDLLIQKKRLKENYVREITFINDKIKGMKRSIDENYKQQS